MKNIIFVQVDSYAKVGYDYFIICIILADTLQKKYERSVQDFINLQLRF